MGQTSVSCEEVSEPEQDIERGARRRKKLKVLVVMTVAVVLGALGDISLSHGMKTIEAANLDGVHQTFLAAVTSPYLLGGVGLLLTFLILYLVSLSWEELSYVLPLTAADYVLVTIFARFILQESVPPFRWLGSALVALGIYLVARS